MVMSRGMATVMAMRVCRLFSLLFFYNYFEMAICSMKLMSGGVTMQPPVGMLFLSFLLLFFLFEKFAHGLMGWKGKFVFVHCCPSPMFCLIREPTL